MSTLPSKPVSSVQADVLSATYAQAISARSRMVAAWLGEDSEEEEDEADKIDKNEGKTSSSSNSSEQDEAKKNKESGNNNKAGKDNESGDEDADPVLLFNALPSSYAGLGSKAAKQKESGNMFNRGAVFKNGFRHEIKGQQQSNSTQDDINSKHLVQNGKTLNTIRNQLTRVNQRVAGKLRLAQTAGSFNAKNGRRTGNDESDSGSDSDDEISKGSSGNKRKAGGKTFFDQYKKSKKK